MIAPLGSWAYLGDESKCASCRGATIEVPREGHALSKYWSLECGDGARLRCCAADCTEEIADTPPRRKRGRR